MNFNIPPDIIEFMKSVALTGKPPVKEESPKEIEKDFLWLISSSSNKINEVTGKNNLEKVLSILEILKDVMKETKEIIHRAEKFNISLEDLFNQLDENLEKLKEMCNPSTAIGGF